MEDLKERLTTCISTPELERRWKLARELMKENKIDFLLMRQDEEFLGGYVRWFSDFSARHSYPFTVIFHRGPSSAGRHLSAPVGGKGREAKTGCSLFRIGPLYEHL